jgi:hypothetical protein
MERVDPSGTTHTPGTMGAGCPRTAGQRPDVHRISTDVHVTRTPPPGAGGEGLRPTAVRGACSLAGRAAPVAIRIALPVTAARTAIPDARSSGPAGSIPATRAGRARASVRAAALSPAGRRSGSGTDDSRHGTTALRSADSSWVIVSSHVHAAPSHHVRTPFEPVGCAATGPAERWVRPKAVTGARLLTHLLAGLAHRQLRATGPMA